MIRSKQLQVKMKFEDFKLLKVNFKLNEDYDAGKDRDVPDGWSEFTLENDVRRKEKEVLVAIGIRQLKGNCPYHYEVLGAGIFSFKKLPDDNMLEQLTSINCPAILFPYLRESIADLTRRAGFDPLHIDPINFIELARQRAEKEKTKASPKKLKASAKKKATRKKKTVKKKKSKAK